MQDSNEKRLEQMRQTVEEKLEQTLQTRLQASFETVKINTSFFWNFDITVVLAIC